MVQYSKQSYLSSHYHQYLALVAIIGAANVLLSEVLVLSLLFFVLPGTGHQSFGAVPFALQGTEAPEPH